MALQWNCTLPPIQGYISRSVLLLSVLLTCYIGLRLCERMIFIVMISGNRLSGIIEKSHRLTAESAISARIRIFPIFVLYKSVAVWHTWGESFFFSRRVGAFFRYPMGKACMSESHLRLMGFAILRHARTRREI